ncbi:HIT-like domain containing protein [Nitzschia inconspicua]|uniref:HIT-like domain containing protein n=1 Tax=Nitzschia inconspicua TaxID=303405 RepID=A0A9K3PHF4_9STRA|nr:HIT-like domain containing protein [Nitzschia inconspicua]
MLLSPKLSFDKRLAFYFWGIFFSCLERIATCNHLYCPHHIELVHCLVLPPTHQYNNERVNRVLFRLHEKRIMIPTGSADDDTTRKVPDVGTRPTTTTTTAWPLFPPPPGVDYTKNPTVFGKILQGKITAKVLDESPELLAFQDIRPRAPLHALVIPKRYIPTIANLNSQEEIGTNGSIQLLQQMEVMAHRLLKQHLTYEQYQSNDYLLCFHIPPFTSVDHLHLHVLAPASQMQWMWKDVKYNIHQRWCISLEEVQSRLQRGQSAIPYDISDPWWKILYQVVCPAYGRK